MTENYVVSLIALFEKQIEALRNLQDSDLVLSLNLADMHLAGLKQARNKCDFENQLYCVNRLARILGEIEGRQNARQEAAAEKAREEKTMGEVRNTSDGRPT